MSQPRARARPLVRPLLTALLLVLAAPTARATPPRPPLELALVPLAPPRAGGEVAFAIEVTPLLPGERLHVSIVPPRDVVLARGRALETRRDVGPGRTQRFEAAVRVPPGRRHHVYVRAELVTAGGRRYTRGEHLVVLVGPLASPEPVSRVVPDGQGGAVVEHEAGKAGAR